MRAEWDRRVSHDYRFWMSDGVDSDESMWQTGYRDLEILLQGLDRAQLKQQTALELGCGVGRLLRPASEVFSSVIGLDVSTEALKRAQTLLADRSNIKLLEGNGLSLQPIANESVDFAFTFAALSSMPLRVIASYFCELSRVLKVGAQARLQVYLGDPRQTVESDTIAIRSFPEENFIAAMSKLGFQVTSLSELRLPFAVSDPASKLYAKIASLQKKINTELELSSVLAILCPETEQSASPTWPGSETEYGMALTRARQQLEAGKLKEAREALDFAVSYYHEPEEEVLQMLAALREKEKVLQTTLSAHTNIETTLLPLSDKFSSQIYQANLSVIQQRFPVFYQELMATEANTSVQVKCGTSGEPVLICRGIPLDNIDKPRRAGEAWAERFFNAQRTGEAKKVIVAGFAGGYHLEALLKRSIGEIHVIEPQLDVFHMLISVRDCRALLEQIGSLSSSRGFSATALSPELDELQLVVHPQTYALAKSEIEEIRRQLAEKRGLAKIRPTIAVIGPIYGGSQPIALYVASALQRLKQRVYLYDLKGFYDAYLQMNNFVQDKGRISVLQGHYVEFLSQIVLEALTEKPVDIVIALAQAPLSGRVLEELRSRGVITAMWFVEDCRRFTSWRDISRYYDYMFLLQKGEFPRLIEQAGAGKAHYLPVGCDPELHRPMYLNKEELAQWGSAVSFVGAGYNNRQQMFARLATRDFKIWGSEWPNCPPFDKLVQANARRVTPEEYVKVFNASAVNINLHSSKERDGVEPYGDFVNPRTFELAACEAFQLIDKRSLLPELFTPEDEVATFSDLKELEEKIDYYLMHPEERILMAKRARERALREHSYEKRVETMLGYIYADRFEELRAKLESRDNPWQATIKEAEEFPELQKRLQAAFERGDEPKMDSLIADIKTGEGKLTETEQKLLFLHHIRSQITYVNELRDGK